MTSHGALSTVKYASSKIRKYEINNNDDDTWVQEEDHNKYIIAYIILYYILY